MYYRGCEEMMGGEKESGVTLRKSGKQQRDAIYGYPVTLTSSFLGLPKASYYLLKSGTGASLHLMSSLQNFFLWRSKAKDYIGTQGNTN